CWHAPRIRSPADERGRKSMRLSAGCRPIEMRLCTCETRLRGLGCGFGPRASRGFSHNLLASWFMLVAASASVAAAAAVYADGPAALDVDVSKPGPPIPARFFGLMTEEINHAYDGGLYAELIQNRTFQ